MSRQTPKRLILGFDAGCSTCAEMAQKVKEKVGDKLEVVNLREPQVMEWRKEALGEDTPWAPTLFEVNGEAVKAWTGKRMGLKLGRALGVVATWRVMQVLGEVGATPEVTEASPVARIGAGISRGQFLKGVGGAAVAMGVLSATGKLASPAQAAIPFKDITGPRLVEIARRVAGSRDVVNVAGKQLQDKVRRGGVIRQCQNGTCVTVINDGNCRVRQVNGEISFSGDCIVISAAQRTLENGINQLVVTYGYSNRAVLYYEYDRPSRGVKNEAYAYRTEGSRAILEALSENDVALDLLPEPEPKGTFSAQAVPPSQRTCPSRCGYKRVCSDFDWYCLAAGCVLCPFTCPVTGPGCAVCLGVLCAPVSSPTGRCCNRSYLTCRCPY